MTRMATGLEAFRGQGRGVYKPEKWFVAQEPILTGLNWRQHYSPILPDGSIIKEIQIHAYADSAFQLINCGVKVFHCTDINITWPQIIFQEPVINFEGGVLPGEWWGMWGPRDESYKIKKQVKGANQRVGVNIYVNCTFDVGVRVGVRYEEP